MPPTSEILRYHLYTSLLCVCDGGRGRGVRGIGYGKEEMGWRVQEEGEGKRKKQEERWGGKGRRSGNRGRRKTNGVEGGWRKIEKNREEVKDGKWWTGEGKCKRIKRKRLLNTGRLLGKVIKKEHKRYEKTTTDWWAEGGEGEELRMDGVINRTGKDRVHTRVYIHEIYLNIYIYRYTYLQMYVSVHLQMHVYTHTQTHTHINLDSEPTPPAFHSPPLFLTFLTFPLYWVRQATATRASERARVRSERKPCCWRWYSGNFSHKHYLLCLDVVKRSAFRDAANRNTGRVRMSFREKKNFDLTLAVIFLC